MRSPRLPVVGAVATIAMLGIAGTASADRGTGSETIRLQDDCDPATFNAAFGAGVCVGDGDTTVDEFFAVLGEDGAIDDWTNHPDETRIERGGRVHLDNEGGEFHTFTAVRRFGPGCIQGLNDLLGLTGPPVANCTRALARGNPTALPAGGKSDVPARMLRPGSHKFQCMIHPWMHATVEVGRG